jgi:hypothetical protein
MKNRKVVVIAFLVIAAMMLGIGYAALTDTLDITGSADVNVSDLEKEFEEDIYFSAAVPNNGAPDTASVNADNNNEYKLMYSFNMPERFESNGWIVRFTKKSAEKVLAEEKTAAYQPVIVFSEDALLINQPQHQIKLSTKYNALGFFSASELRKVIGNKAEMITFTKSFLFSAAVAGTPTAILQMVGLMALQYAFYIVVAAFLLSMSRLRAMKGTNLEKISKFFPSVKILATLGFLPSIIVALISYFNSSFGMSFGWVVFCLIVGVRTIIIYMKRVRSKSVAEL